MTTPTDATLHIERRAGPWRDRLRKYVVLLDGAPIAELRPGDSQTVVLAPGGHRVQMKVGFGRSAELVVSVGAGEERRLSCQPGGSAFGAVTSLFRPARWVELEEAEAERPGTKRVRRD